LASPLFRNLTIAAIALAVVVVVLGAFTRLVDAGLGCPDWPGCYGHLLWPDTEHEIARASEAFPDAPVDLDKTWPEMVHRYFAGSLLLLVGGLCLLAWRDKAPAFAQGAQARTLTTSLLILITCQAAFGAWTVTLKLWPQVVTAHLLGGFATLSLLWVILLRQQALPALSLSSAALAPLRRHAVLALIVVVVQVVLGGWVSSNYAALACTDFPTCYGSYWPPMDVSAGFDIHQSVGPNYLGGVMESEARVAVHWVHRLGAVVVMFVVGALALRLWRVHRLLASALAGVLALQLLLGTLNVVWALPLGVATAHNACGALLLLAVVTINFAPPHSASIDPG